ncbi:MAG: gamma-glutamylcyclotransferase [Myxococcota bacterium]|nr:gamma-glutamylcyclotransferase [Myxococcota bacterium]
MKSGPESSGSVWIFGYGSLIWRPDFAFAERRHGYIRDYARRFWQGSTDHRGTVDFPGRVVTLIDQPGAICWGTAYRVHLEQTGAVLDGLDRRESGGFRREVVEVCMPESEGDTEKLSAQLYLAPAENPNYLGPDSLPAIARQICTAQGPSGPNVEYALELACALREMGAEDDHVFSLEALILERKSGGEGDKHRPPVS